MPEDKKADYAPDLVITLGGHIVSKRLKQYLRANKPESHWHLTQSGEVTDLFQSLTDLIEADNEKYLNDLCTTIPEETNKPYFDLWRKASDAIKEPSENTPFSDLLAAGAFVKALPKGAMLHLANSSTVRNVQLYAQDPSIEVFCNRGTNGIESSLPTAVGFASVYKGITYLMIGDLSFFYGIGSLWNIGHIRNLRILLINNGGGGIFHLLPGLNKATSLTQYVAATHTGDARKWTEATGFEYLSANNKEELNTNLDILTDETLDKSIILEVTTDMEVSKQAFKEYYHKLI
jgi:2-succinyl-5-enolpyruvyl-6-hydroxy-3-cyclohexene-1-carboxylate synthase